MPTLIKDDRVVTDDWILREEIAGRHRCTAHASFPPPTRWRTADTLFGQARDIGIWLARRRRAGQDRVAVDEGTADRDRFAAFNDGRGLSLAVLLRTRFGYTGELRAIGEVHEDVLHYMRRCGIDSYQLPDGHDPAVALAAMQTLTDFYQGSVIDPRPAFRRVARGRK